MALICIGLMSGTSLDGIDGVAVAFEDDDAAGFRSLAHVHRPFAAPLRDELAALNRSSTDEVHRAALAGNALALGYAGVVEAVLARAGLERGRVAAIGCHGQTIRHRPLEFDGIGYTVQIGAPALLAERTGIDVVCDFRSRDVAAGGQGAPLVPAFHRAAFARAGEALAVLNLGGIANLTSIGADGATTGFDCGPGNGLLDAWSARSTGAPFDDGGARASRGAVDARLLDALLAEPYFALPPPKSTGRDLFDVAWLDARLAAADATGRLSSDDVQATLAELTARSCGLAVRRHAGAAREVVVCGGGAFNRDLLARLARHVEPAGVVTSDVRGVPPDRVEASAFAWLAKAFLRREAGNLAAVTGAAGPRVLGALYPAG